MKKILYIIYFLFLIIQTTFASLEVKTNINSWNYNFPIEIFLIANEKDAKIFYYTDNIWNIDSILEYKKPILIKKDTIINFFATNKDFEDTLIKSSNYTFSYSDKIYIILNDNEIIIKNNSNELQNIWYWLIETDKLHYEITPNTFLDIWKSYKINYKLKNLEKVFLYTPDNKLKKEVVFKDIEKKETQEKKVIVEEINENLENNSGEIIQTWSENKLIEKEINTQILNNNEDNLEKKDDFNVFQNIKTNLNEPKQKSNATKKLFDIYLVLYIFVTVKIISILIYYFYLKKK